MAAVSVRVTDLEIGVAEYTRGNPAVAGSATLVDGICVLKELGEFAEAVRKVLRGVKFGIPTSYRQEAARGGWGYVVTDLWMYFEGDAHATMRIGYRDYSLKHNAERTYGVYARGIQNEKYSAGREQRHTVTCSGLARAVGNVKTHYRPFTKTDVALMSMIGMRDRVVADKSKVNDAAYSAKHAVTNHTAFRGEMQLLLNTGYVFADSSFASVVKTMVEKYKEQQTQQYAPAAVNAHHVYVRVVGNTQLFDITYVTNIQAARSGVGISPDASVTYAPADVPEDIVAKVSTLSILGDNAYISGVGLRVSAYEYWVIQ